MLADAERIPPAPCAAPLGPVLACFQVAVGDVAGHPQLVGDVQLETERRGRARTGLDDLPAEVPARRPTRGDGEDVDGQPVASRRRGFRQLEVDGRAPVVRVVIVPQPVFRADVDDGFHGFRRPRGEHALAARVGHADDGDVPSHMPRLAFADGFPPDVSCILLDHGAAFGAFPFGLERVGAAPPFGWDVERDGREPVSAGLLRRAWQGYRFGCFPVWTVGHWPASSRCICREAPALDGCLSPMVHVVAHTASSASRNCQSVKSTSVTFFG